MPARSKSGNVKKLCDCARWSCAHPWYVDYKAAKDHPTRPNERYRKNLDELTGRHAVDMREAQAEAMRAITIWLDGRNPADLQPEDRPTLAQVVDTYQRRPNASDAKYLIGPILRTKVQGRPFGKWHVEEITREALDAFRKQRPLVAGNRGLAYLRAMFNWAVVAGLVTRTPFRVGDVAVVRLARETARARRLQGDEGERLMLAANGLGPLITAALESGCRLGELLSLQWHQVWFSPRAELFLPAQKTKAKKDRRVPISSGPGGLLAVLQARRNDPGGNPLPGDAFVFGDEVGRRRRSIKTAWRLACKRANIEGLHFHDLRRECGSRWMDAGVPLATIQRWLGHHNISQTSTYLAASLGGDADEMRAFEQRIGRLDHQVAGKPSDPPLPQIDTNAGAIGQQGTESVPGVLEKTNKNWIGPEPTGVVH